MLARAWSRFKEPAYLTAAQQALGVFQTPPPRACASTSAPGAHYAEYTYAPSDRILNGFIQALVGLYDYTSITKDPLGLAAVRSGRRRGARAQVPHYDTGAWSLYDQYGESDLSYHELLTEFLQHLCERTRKGQPLTPAARSGAGPAPSPTPTPTTRRHAGNGPAASAAATQRGAPPRPPPSPAIPGDQIYCTTAQRFTADLTTPPAIALLTQHAARRHARGRADVAVEDLDRHADRPPGRRRSCGRTARRVERGQAAAAVGDAAQGGGTTRSRSPRPTWRATSPRASGTIIVTTTSAGRRSRAPRLGAVTQRSRRHRRRRHDAAHAAPGARWSPSSASRLAPRSALFVTMFLPWYSRTRSSTPHGQRRCRVATSDAFQVFSFVEAAVLLVAVGVLVLLFARAEGRDFQLPGGDGTVVCSRRASGRRC